MNYETVPLDLNKEDWQSMEKIMSHHHLSLYRKIMTVLNKAKHEIKSMSHHSKHHFITQYISLRGTAVNEFYRMTRMGVAGHVRGNPTETNE